MSRKPKHPYRHSGKLLLIREAEQIEAEAEAASQPGAERVVPSLDYFRQVVATLFFVEMDMAGDDIDELKRRTATLAEAGAWINLLERFWTDDNGADQPVSADDAKVLAFNALRVGMLLAKAQWRLMEGFAVDALDVAENAAKQAEQNKGKGFQLDRETLLAEMKKAAVMHRSANQRRLCEIVANKVSTKDRKIGGERVKQLLNTHKIKATDYKPKI